MMTRREFERAGYKVLSCDPNPNCYNGYHIHCEITEGVEYCPDRKRIIVLSTMIIGKPIYRLCVEDVRLYATVTTGVFTALHPTWELEDITFV